MPNYPINFFPARDLGRVSDNMVEDIKEVFADYGFPDFTIVDTSTLQYVLVKFVYNRSEHRCNVTETGTTPLL